MTYRRRLRQTADDERMSCQGNQTCNHWTSLYQITDSGSTLLTSDCTKDEEFSIKRSVDASVKIQDWMTQHGRMFNSYSFMYCRWYGFYLPILINTSKGKDLKFAFHCQEILLHCFDVWLPEMSSAHKSPHVLMTFNPSESIAAEVFRNISIFCQKNSWHNYSRQQLLDLSEVKK